MLALSVPDEDYLRKALFSRNKKYLRFYFVLLALKKIKITQNKCIMGGVQLKKEASLSCDFIMVWVIGVSKLFQLYRGCHCISGRNTILMSSWWRPNGRLSYIH
jgi:hypothetical protein